MMRGVMLLVKPAVIPTLDTGFAPASLWNREFRRFIDDDRGARPFILALEQPGAGGEAGVVSRHESRVLGAGHPAVALNFEYAERLLKFLLWQRGGCRVYVAGAPEIAARLARIYSSGGGRAFDCDIMGAKIYGRDFEVVETALDAVPATRDSGAALGRNLDGCRIGFDIGGSDRKAAALIDGRVVFSEEISWDPYFQKDPAYHIEGVHDSLRRAAAHLPRVDAIGGSAAGVYVNNEVRVGSLFRGVPPELFERDIRRMFFTLRERWGGVPFEVVNDGEVTALAGSMALGSGAVLGVSMGTSMAGGYVRPDGAITPWLNELAFAPVDYRDGAEAPRDEWSGDRGCGVQYFSQQGVARLAGAAGFDFPGAMPAAERLVAVQEALAGGGERAARIYETIGVCFGYAIAHYAEFLEIKHVLALGRVTSGAGGGILLEKAREALRAEFPALAEKIRLSMPDEKDKRHGQAVAAASLPRLEMKK